MGVNKSRRPELAPYFETPLQMIREARVPLSAAQLQAMFAAPVSILPAPGAGFALIIDQCEVEIIAGGTAFTGGGAISFVYHGVSGSNPHSGSIPATALTTAVGTTVIELGPPTPTNGLTIPANTGLDITNATAAFASGNGSAVALVQYRIIQL
jgi:hypothetical protein